MSTAIRTNVPPKNSVIPGLPIGKASCPDHTVGANATTTWPVMLRPHDVLLTASSTYRYACTLQVMVSSD